MIVWVSRFTAYLEDMSEVLEWEHIRSGTARLARYARPSLRSRGAAASSQPIAVQSLGCFVVGCSRASSVHPTTKQPATCVVGCELAERTRLSAYLFLRNNR